MKNHPLTTHIREGDRAVLERIGGGKRKIGHAISMLIDAYQDASEQDAKIKPATSPSAINIHQRQSTLNQHIDARTEEQRQAVNEFVAAWATSAQAENGKG